MNLFVSFVFIFVNVDSTLCIIYLICFCMFLRRFKIYNVDYSFDKTFIYMYISNYEFSRYPIYQLSVISWLFLNYSYHITQ